MADMKNISKMYAPEPDRQKPSDSKTSSPESAPIRERQVRARWTVTRKEVETYTLTGPDLRSIVEAASVPAGRAEFADLALRERLARHGTSRGLSLPPWRPQGGARIS